MLVLLISVGWIGAGQAASAEEPTILVDGYVVENLESTVIDGQVMVPLEAVAQALGTEVTWNYEANVVELSTRNPFAKAVNEVRPAIVGVVVKRQVHYGGETTEVTGHGTGIIRSSNGYILTNEHVVSDAEEIFVVLSDGRVFDAELWNWDELSDLAQLKIEAENLPMARFAIDEPTVGERVIAVGNPLTMKYHNTVTAGIISGIGREAEGWVPLLQTDAAVNPGNSGGPLVNLAGEVVGIVSSKVASVDVEGIGFAIPTKTVRDMLDDWQPDGIATRPYLGIRAEESWAASYGLPSTEGLQVTLVVPEGPADNAGVEVGDTITALAGRDVYSSADLIESLKQQSTGDEITLTVKRDGLRRELSLVLATRPPEREMIHGIPWWSGGPIAWMTEADVDLAMAYGEAYSYDGLVDLIGPWTAYHRNQSATLWTYFAFAAAMAWQAEVEGEPVTLSQTLSSLSQQQGQILVQLYVTGASSDFSAHKVAAYQCQATVPLYPKSEDVKPSGDGYSWTPHFTLFIADLDPTQWLTVVVTDGDGEELRFQFNLNQMP